VSRSPVTKPHRRKPISAIFRL